MILPPPSSTRTDPLFPYTTPFRSRLAAAAGIRPQGGVRVLAELLERIGHRASSDVVGCHWQSTPPAVRRQRWEGRRDGKVVEAAEPGIGRAMKCQRATCRKLNIVQIPTTRKSEGSGKEGTGR